MDKGSTASIRVPEYARTLGEEIPALMQANAIPGAVVLIESPKLGNWRQSFGVGAIGTERPMRMDDHLRVGSNTKTMTTTVILQLVEEGKLRLSDPVSKFWPDVPNGENITIAQLAKMRSGLFNYSEDPEFNAKLDRSPQKGWRPKELLKIAFSHPPSFAPGAEFEYSNTNYILLGGIIEQLTGMSASQAFEERIFEPLGLRNSLLPLRKDSSLPKPHPQGYQFGTNLETLASAALPPAEAQAAVDGTLAPINATRDNPSWGWTAGSAISTVDDLSVYVKALVEGGLLDRGMQKKRLRSILPIDPANPDVAGYGLGLVRFGTRILGHDGQLPGFMTFMGHDPKAGNTIIVGTNLTASPVSGEGSALILAKAILRELYGASAVPGASPSQNPSTTTTSAAGARAGTGTGTAGGGTLPTSLIQASPDQLELLRQLIAADGSGIHRLRYGLTAPGFDNGNLAAGLGTPPVAIAASPEEQSFIRQVFDRLAQVIRLQAVQDNQLSSPLQIVSVERVRDDDGLSDEITGITYTGFSFQVEPSGQRTVIPAESGITIEAELNDDPGLSAAEQRTIVHEIGHALGLEHPGGNPNDPNFNDRDTIMSYRLGGSEPATWFSPTDLQALTEIWGAASVVPPAPAPGPAPAPEAEVFRIDAITGTAIPGFRSGSDQLAIAAGLLGGQAPRFKVVNGNSRKLRKGFASKASLVYWLPAGDLFLNANGKGRGLGDGGLLADLDPFTPLQASDIALA